MKARSQLTASLLLFAACQASAQQPADAASQIAAAVAALPEEFQAGATVFGFRAGTQGLSTLRTGTGAFICLADDPADERFHVACYHQSLEPFMLRGRQLRANGVTGAGVDSVRFAEINANKLPMPRDPAALYSLTGDLNATSNARRLYVVYIPFATAESTGLPKTPAPNMPWIMFPGTPKAHIMFVPTM